MKLRYFLSNVGRLSRWKKQTTPSMTPTASRCLSTAPGLKERISNGETIVVAEGYAFEFERRGYLRCGDWVPEVVLNHPNLVRNMHEEFVHAGSDVVLAFTYHAHRAKLRSIGREDDVDKLNQTALQIAREVARETGSLLAGNICNTDIYRPEDPATHTEVKEMFKEKVIWAAEEEVDFIVGETYSLLGEALLALDVIKEYGKGVPAVITFALYDEDKLFDGTPIDDAARQVAQAGADVVGLNCQLGPKTILHPLRRVKEAVRAHKVPLAALPVPYRTTHQNGPNFVELKDEQGNRVFPDVDPFLCSQKEIREFGEACKELGVQYVGLCCGNCSHYMRALAESFGKTPPASKYGTDHTGYINVAQKYEIAGK